MSGLPVAGTRCPWCGRANDCTTPAGTSKVPKAGDVSICWGCLRVGIFTRDGGVRRPTPVEDVELGADTHLQDALALARTAREPLSAAALMRARDRGRS